MKKLLLFLLPLASLAQSFTITPTELNKSQTLDLNDDIIVSRFGTFPSVVGQRANGTATTPLAIINNNLLFNISGYGYNGSTFSNSSRIDFNATENWTTGSTGSKIKFLTVENGSNVSFNRMTIDHNGNVGIGSFDNPLSKLHVRNRSSGVTPFTNTNLFIENDNHNYLHMGTTDGFDNGILFSNTSHTSFGGSIQYKADNRMLFQTNALTRVLINSSGNVGIGTTSPAAKLDVNGDVIIRRKRLLPTTTQTVNDFNRDGASIICTGTATATQTITITGIAGGVDGMMLWVYPTNFFTIRLENEDPGSAATNRIKTTTGSANILSVRGGATLIYDGNEQRWHVVDTN